jgi:hypothetical protein
MLASSVNSFPKMMAVGSPGVMYIIENTTKVSMKTTGTRAINLFRIYVIMRFSYTE